MQGLIYENEQLKVVNLTLITPSEDDEGLSWYEIEDVSIEDFEKVANDSDNPDAEAWD